MLRLALRLLPTLLALLRVLLELRLLLKLLELRLLLELLRLLPMLLELPRLLLIELLWPPPLWLPPPPRLPPRCARAGEAHSAKATIVRVITFEVFISLLLSFIYCFSILFLLTHSHISSFTHSRVLFLMQKYNLFLGEIPNPVPNFPAVLYYTRCQ